MEVRVLRYFLTVAQEGTVTGAAERLHVTQPTLSRQLKDLEHELGVRLLEKKGRNVVLTKEGALFRRRAEDAVGVMEKLEEEFRGMGSELAGEVYIGSGETEAMALVAEVIKRARRDYPNIRFDLVDGNMADLTDRIDRGVLDFGVLIQPANKAKYETLDLPCRDEWVFITRRDNPLANRAFIEPADLLGEPMLMARQALYKNMPDNNFTQWLGDALRRLNVVATFNLPFNASILVREGLGSLITLDRLIDTREGSDLAAIPLRPRLYAGLSLVWRRNQTPSQAAAVFLEYFKRYVTELEEKDAAHGK